jgi:hypothetical protein
MKHANLDHIIKLKEFKYYLSSGELLELSMSSKRFRKSLNLDIFNSFCLKSFAKVMGYKSGVIDKGDGNFEAIEGLYLESKDIKEDEDKNTDIRGYLINSCSDINEGENDKDQSSYSEDEYNNSDNDSGYEYSNTYIHNPYKPLTEDYLEIKDMFQTELSQLQFRPKKLKIGVFSEGYNYLIGDLCNTFFNINNLSISWSMIKLETLQNMLNSLSCLECLKLCGNTIVKSSSSSNSYSINWPLNLKKLEISYNDFGYITDNEDYIKSTSLGSPLIYRYDLNLSPKSLPSLHTLALVQSVHIDESENNYDNQFLKFLKMNPHIKNLEIAFRILQDKFFEAVSSFNNLTKLRLTMANCGNKDTFLAIKSPTLSNLKSLDFDYEYGAYVFKFIGQQFPNLTHLTYYPEYLLLNNVEQYNTSLEILERFKYLKTLKLKGLGAYTLSLLNLPKLNNLENLEVFSENNFELSILSSNDKSCPNLKLVKFTKFNGNSVIEQPELISELETRYKFLYFPYTLAFYNKDKI